MSDKIKIAKCRFCGREGIGNFTGKRWYYACECGFSTPMNEALAKARELWAEINAGQRQGDAMPNMTLDTAVRICVETIRDGDVVRRELLAALERGGSEKGESGEDSSREGLGNSKSVRAD